MSAEPHNLLPFSSVSAREDELARRLTPRQLGVIASGGAIGTGLFLGSSIAVRLAGPGIYRDDAHRFLDGAPHIPALYAATPGLDVARGPEVLQELRRNFLVDYRPNAGRRASPHFYNTEEEIDRLAAEIASLLASS